MSQDQNKIINAKAIQRARGAKQTSQDQSKSKGDGEQMMATGIFNSLNAKHDVQEKMM